MNFSNYLSFMRILGLQGFGLDVWLWLMSSKRNILVYTVISSEFPVKIDLIYKITCPVSRPVTITSPARLSS